MKTRLILLLSCTLFFASFVEANPKAVYSWTVIDSDKEFLARYLYLDVESDKVIVEKNNREFKIPFERLTRNCKERVLILDNQQILQGQIERLEESISRLDKLAGRAIGRLDERLQKIEANFVNANPVVQRQQAKPRAVFMGPNGQEFDNPNDAFNANQRQNQIDDMQRRMDQIEFEREAQRMDAIMQDNLNIPGIDF